VKLYLLLRNLCPLSYYIIVTGICELFPDKLYRMLLEVEANGEDEIIKFLPHGRAFLIKDHHRLVSDVLPRYFNEQKNGWNSFVRQLQLYGFLRCTSSTSMSSSGSSSIYYHELFLKGHSHLCKYMRRVGTPRSAFDRRRYKLPAGKDPNFDSMKPTTTLSATNTTVSNAAATLGPPKASVSSSAFASRVSSSHLSRSASSLSNNSSS